MLSSYIKNTAHTAVYPEAGTGSATVLTYLALGLVGESAETLGASAGETLAELGDVAWYLARFYSEFDLVIPEHLPTGDWTVKPPVLTDLVVATGRVAEMAKKVLRDDAGQLSDVKKQALQTQLDSCWVLFSHLCSSYGFSAQLVLDKNLAKLSSRKQRGVLSGSGDHR